MFEIKIKTGNSAFQVDEKLDPTGHEVRRLMKCIDALLKSGVTSGVLMDINGNRIGEWRYE